MNSLAKGKRYERSIARKLSKAFGIKFFRVPQSGATATSNNLKNFHGDVFTEDENFNKTFNCIIECKKIHAPITLYNYIQYLKGESCVLKSWVEQCISESGSRNFWLIFAWDGGKDFIITGHHSGSDVVACEPVLLEDYLKRNKEE